MSLTLALGGCGYRFTAGGAPLPEGIRDVRVPVFVNRTAEPGVEIMFTEALREEARRAGVREDSAATARVEGEVKALTGGPTILAKNGSLASYRLTAVAHLKLLQAERVLADVEVAGQEDYLPNRDAQGLVVGEVLAVETNRQAALRRLAKSLMHDGYERLASGW